MPLYTYRCNDCSHQFDIRQRMSDDPLKDCPNCEGNLRKVINSVGVVFKGSGFYITDNKTKNSAAPKTNGSSENGESASPTESGGSKESDTTSQPAKPEAKKSDKGSEKVTST